MPKSRAVIERYTLPEMGRIWSDQHRLETWMEVEVLALEAWASLGQGPELGGRGGARGQMPDP